mmetsp:Transcript_54573/g.88122  ORF Transcript_54573/g.88122 Transcript_54573/m.88122 type:complete len:186 (+) Transcript_54573:92-649(+)
MRSSAVGLLATVILGQWLTAESSTFVHRQCKGQTCTSPRSPLLDWEPEHGCHCRPHPCHSDTNDQAEEVVHSCSDPALPFLGFSYSQDGKLLCRCQKDDSQGSVHISRDLCGGHNCPDGPHLLLDWDDDSIDKCVCIKHPCIFNNGVVHECPDPKHPLLKFHYEEDGELACACSANYKYLPADEL